VSDDVSRIFVFFEHWALFSPFACLHRKRAEARIKHQNGTEDPDLSVKVKRWRFFVLLVQLVLLLLSISSQASGDYNAPPAFGGYLGHWIS
jgi:hypothetical protein